MRVYLVDILLLVGKPEASKRMKGTYPLEGRMFLRKYALVWQDLN